MTPLRRVAFAAALVAAAVAALADLDDRAHVLAWLALAVALIALAGVTE